MFENLSEKLERSFKLLKGEGKITELNIAETLKDVRKALLDADVNYKTAKTFVDTVKDKAMGQNVLNAVKPGQMMIKIVHDELAELMGGASEDVNIKGSPAVILMAGLQGSGKTTFSGKLANLLKTKKGKSPCWWRATFIVLRPSTSCRFWASKLVCPFIANLGNNDPVAIAKAGVKLAKEKGL
jgi:signal recognition particle subunit SRP54